MTEFLHPELNKRLRKVINSSPIFQEGKLRGNFNLLCAAMDRIDTCVAYLNKHSNFPRTEEDFIIFLMFAAMLRDAVLDVLVGVLPNFERNSGELHFFKDTYLHSAVYNPDKPVPSDDRFFEYIRTLIDAIPQICDGIENLEELFNIPVYNALRELPKTMPQGTYYQLEKIFTYLDDAYSTGENYAFGLVQAGDFAESFAKKWVVICPQKMPICEILLLVRTACYLEAQAQKRRQPL